MIHEINNTNWNEITSTILVTDIRSFSSVARDNSKDDVGYFINEYITMIMKLEEDMRTEELIEINNFLGDGFLIFFESNMNAIKFALELNKRFKKLGKFSDIKNSGKLGVGTGIHRGEVFYGTFGYGDSNSYRTGIGHEVNMTFRLTQAATRWEILVSEAILPNINTRTVNTCKDKLFVKGARNVIWPYSVIWTDPL